MLAELLSTSPDCSARHECIGDREFWLLSWYLDREAFSVPYLQRERRRIERSANGAALFVDVNSYLRNVVGALKEVFEGPPVFHLVRDPRRVIPSIYARRTGRNVQQIPKSGDDIVRWLESDKFEQICWNWAETTRRLLEEDTITVRFEDVLRDYDYVVERLARPAGLTVTREGWSAATSKKANRTRSRLYRYLYAQLRGEPYVSPMPAFEKWSAHQKAVYREYCGDLAEELGYV